MTSLNLKSILSAALAVAGLAAGSAVAGPTVDVFLKAYDSANSGAGAELAMLADASGLRFTAGSLHKIDGKGGATFDSAENVWVIDLDADLASVPGYFLLKFGLPKLDTEKDDGSSAGGGKGADKAKLPKKAAEPGKPQEDKFNTGLDSYVFRNTGELTQLVWRNSDVNFLTGGDCTTRANDGPCNIDRLSHISWVAGPAPGGEVPEPASLALLGAGLAAIAVRRRRA